MKYLAMLVLIASVAHADTGTCPTIISTGEHLADDPVYLQCPGCDCTIPCRYNRLGPLTLICPCEAYGSFQPHPPCEGGPPS